MYRASVIIPVYNAEKTLARCVESLLYGRERNLELLLVDDYSKDGSWDLCCAYAEKFENVRAFRNDTNRGVSYTRNRGLDEATGEYILFVDSDDWVSGEYAAILLDVAEKCTDAMPVCGFHYLDHTCGTRQDYVWSQGTELVTILTRQELFVLLGKTLLQQLWTKVFNRKAIVSAKLRFKESMTMGEDFQFILEYIEFVGIQKFHVLDRALYYYVRYGSSSLMSQFGMVEKEDEYSRLEKLHQLSGDLEGYETAMFQLKQNYIYHIMHSKLTKKEKMAHIVQLTDNADSCYRRQKVIVLKEQVLSAAKCFFGLLERGKNKLTTLLNRVKTYRFVNRLKTNEFTILSQNCIGGVLYHDAGMAFLSPTINLYFEGPDFVRFVQNLKQYLIMEPEMHWEEEYPIGRLGSVTIQFMHYDNCSHALECWNRRTRRINHNKVLLLCTDRDGFTEEVFEQWKLLPMPKLLFTANRIFANDEDSLFFDKYTEHGKVPDLIPRREFYKGDALLRVLNGL